MPQRQGTLCSRSCIESAGRLRRRLAVETDIDDATTRQCLELDPRLTYLCDHRGGGHWTERLARMRRLGLLTAEQDEQMRIMQPSWAQEQWPVFAD